MKCINISDPKFKRLVELSGLPQFVVESRIQKFWNLYPNADFPSLEFAMTSEESFEKVIDLLKATKYKDNFKISQTKVKEVLNQLGFYEDEFTSLKLFQELNNTYKNTQLNRIRTFSVGNENFVEFEIKKIPTMFDYIQKGINIEIGDILKSLYITPQIKESETPPISSFGEWGVYRYNDKYLVSKGRFNSNSKYSFDTQEKAEIEASNQFRNDNSISVGTYDYIIKNNLNIYDTIKSKGSIKFKVDSNDIKLGDFEIYDIDYPKFSMSNKIDVPYSINSNGNVIKSNISRKEFFEHLTGKTPLYTKIYNKLQESGYDIFKIESILNSNNKILNYNLLKIKYYNDNPEVYAKFINTPHIDTRAQYDVDASVYALKILQGNNISVNSTIEKTQNGNYITLSTKRPTSLYNMLSDKKSPNKENIVNLLQNIKDSYGVNYNIVTTEELKNGKWNKLIELPETKKAFIYNGEIYLNIDKATLSDPIHELTHLFMGSLKQRNFNLYKSYLDRIYELPDYEERQKRYDYLTENDKNEEIFAETFGDYISQNSSANINDWIDVDNSITYEHQRFIDDLISPDKTLTNEPVPVTGNKSLEELMNTFGTAIKKGQISQILDSDFSKLSRQMRNLKSRLLEDNKLKEICY